MSNRQAKHWQHVKENEQLRKVRKEIKRNRKPKGVRRKDWVTRSLDGVDVLYDEDAPQRESIMPRGERERRRSIWTNAVASRLDEEISKGDGPSAEASYGTVGTVLEVSTGMCRVQAEPRVLLCGLRGSLTATDTGFTNVVAVGDQVTVSESGGDRGVVEAVLPRRSVLARPDPFYGHLQQLLVANADQVLIVASWREPAFWPELVDRYLIGAECNRLVPILCVNKVDLAENLAEVNAVVQPYRDLGYQVLLTSTVTDCGIHELRDVLRDQMTVLSGLSGVGKSSLLNAVQPGLRLRASEVSDRKHEGRHTTTQAILLPLEAGGFVVDTPGVREWGLGTLRRVELIRFYPELAEAAKECRFANCSHIHEPGCAVRRAASQRQLSAMRYRNYRKIYEALPR